MIRRLIILLLIVGCVFADTISYNQGNNKRTIENVKFLFSKHQRVYYTDNNGKRDFIDCSSVRRITDKNGNDIDFDCADKSNLINEEIKVESSEDVQSIIQNTEKPLVGGLFILLGSGILLVNTGNECNECDSLDDVEDFANEIKTQNQLGYLFIAIGGFMIAVGI